MSQTNQERELAALRNIGPRTARRLIEAGITSVVELKALGAVAAYRQLKHATPPEISLVALYALHGALTDCAWNELPATRQKLRDESDS